MLFFGQEHAAICICIFAADVAVGVFLVVVASCLKVHVLRKMLSWLLYRGLVVLDLFYRKDISVWACHQTNNVGRGPSK